MDYKDLLTIILSSSVISTGVTTFLSPVLEFIKSKCEQNICPYCGYMHNSEEDCPSCSISWVDAIDIEDKFNESCKDDENLQRLVNMCANKGRGSLEFITYPINKDKWIDNMKEFLNTSN